jgi:hypothetical protein
MMLHRLKLKVIYGDPLKNDRSAKKLKLRVILIAGFAVFVPFLAVTYLLWAENRVMKLLFIGFLSALACVPVVLYAYSKGFGRPLKDLWAERPEELKWLSLKIGFLYGFALYWMILGIVEFLFGYQSFRAALISFVASAAARDGFEIGYLRGLKTANPSKIKVFPDNRRLSEVFPVAGQKIVLLLSSTVIGCGMLGSFLGPLLGKSQHQVLAAGLVIGGLSTFSYAWTMETAPSIRSLIQYFIWPGFTMSVTYFLILAYLLRIIFQVELSPAVDFAVLMSASAAWLTLESVYMAYLKGSQEIQSAPVVS